MKKSELKSLIKECINEVQQEQLNEQMIQKAIDYIKNKIPREKIVNWLNWIKKGLQQEWKESKEMMHVWAKMIKKLPVTKEEKKAAKEQLQDIGKMGIWAVIGISPLPEPIEVPIVLALAKLFKVDLLPSSFRFKVDYSPMDTAGGTPEEDSYSVDEELS